MLKNIGRWHPRAAFFGEMRAISAFSADYLLQTAEADIYPYRPDIIIMHAYGPYGEGKEWEQILRQFRRRTSADIILLGNHPRLDGELVETTDPAAITGFGENWVNYVFAPRVAAELGLCYPDNRTAFKRYLLQKGQPVKTILSDTIHFNELGSEIQLAILRRFLRAPRLFPPIDPFNNGRVQTHPVGENGLHWDQGRMRLEFVGNRLDALVRPGPAVRCRVLVDGQVPTSLGPGMGHRRTSWWKRDNGYRPAILKIGFSGKPLVERWTLTVTGENPKNPNDFEFEVNGSLTGPDGFGSSTNLFVSKSGRVRIGPENWNLLTRPSGQIGTQINWDTEERATDQLGGVSSTGTRLEVATTVINDLEDGAHTVELIADDPGNPTPLIALRVYHPGGAMAGTELQAGETPMLRCLAANATALSVWPAAAHGWHLYGRSSLSEPWAPMVGSRSRRFDFMIQPMVERPLELLRLDQE